MSCHNICTQSNSQTKSTDNIWKYSIKINIGNKTKGHSGMNIFKNWISWILSLKKK